MQWLEKYTDHAYALLRIMTGWMFAFHGAQKLFGVLSDHPQPEMWTQVWFGGIIEFVGGLLVAVGLQTRAAAFLASGTMAVAYFQFHWKFQGGRNFWPSINQGEMAVLYCFIFLYIVCRGSGKWSVDKN